MLCCAVPCCAAACSPRSRYTHLSWALWEKEGGHVEEARRLFKQGAALNPRDAAILQVCVCGGRCGWLGDAGWEQQTIAAR